MIDFDEIRKQVAIKHNVLIGKEDPVLVTVTVSEMVLDRYLDLVSEHYEDATRALAVSMEQQVEQAKGTSAKIITDASNYVSDQVRQAVIAAVSEAGGELRRQISAAQTASRDSVASGRDAQTAKNGAFLAAVVASVAAVVAVAALVIVLVR
ncbi:conjugal transfer protein TraM [Pseudomonas coleopterorum]|uniref:conjugal transfer protein TraM n=1 Tax=Pseudomonas coleopterorum TaxID=1605838 RepID=UPI0017813F59|nr:conjugal transfer protein TraM [Pseudomonas coleopterorum]MBD8483940.1 conjugal transfer protein TraM [Pseudomonas coleopterorum]